MDRIVAGLVVAALILSNTATLLLYKDAAGENRELRDRIAELGEELARAWERGNETLNQVENLSNTLEEYEAMLENLSSRAAELEAALEEARSQASELNESLSALRMAYDSLIQVLREVAYWHDYYPLVQSDDYNQHMERVLWASIETTPEPPEGDPLEQAWWAFNYTIENYFYNWDPYTRVYFPGLARPLPWPQVTSLPNETSLIGGGDCEDLSLVAYGILAKALGVENVYMVYVLAGEGMGHAAVLARTVQGWVIVDPAGDYLNGAGLRLIVGAEQLNPLLIPPDARAVLVGQGAARLEWIGGPPEPADDLARLLRSWLEDYWGFTGYTLTVRGIGLHLTAETPEELASRLGG